MAQRPSSADVASRLRIEKAFGTKQIKTSCCDCENEFHGTCVKLIKVDIDYLFTAGIVWRCGPCSEARRRSMSLESEASDGKLTIEDVMKAIQELTNEHKLSIKEFNKAYEALNEKLDENAKILKEQAEKMKHYLEQIDSLATENKFLKGRVITLEGRLDEADQYSRRNCIEIQGVPVQHNDVIQTVKNVGKALGKDIEDSMIDACHTLGKKT
ncbi:hypothetical protein J6590_086816 [Homalodisca vitripennis]|nr:hypothetical protein J6590_086816 [Homalodisca vitripennis]